MLDATDAAVPFNHRTNKRGAFCGRAALFAEIGTAVAELPAERRAEAATMFLPDLIARPGLLQNGECACPETGYGRCNIYFCPRELFTIVAVVWPAGIVSPIHDHLTWCAYGVVSGAIEETRYDAVDCGEPARAFEAGRTHYQAGAATYLPGARADIHSIHNPTQAPAVTLHVYGGDARKTGPNVKMVYRADA